MTWLTRRADPYPMCSATAVATTTSLVASHSAHVASAETIAFFARMSDTVMVICFVLPLLSSIYYAVKYLIDGGSSAVAPKEDVEA